MPASPLRPLYRTFVSVYPPNSLGKKFERFGASMNAIPATRLLKMVRTIQNTTIADMKPQPKRKPSPKLSSFPADVSMRTSRGSGCTDAIIA